MSSSRHHTFRRSHIALLVAAAAVHALPLGASLVVELDLLAIHARAGTILHGRCDAKKEVPDGQPLPYTEYTFTVLNAVKGCRDAQGKVRDRLTFRHAGTSSGSTSGSGVETAPLRLGLPEYRVGDEAILFLTKESRYGLCAPVGLSQGKFSVQRKNGRALVLNPRGHKLFAGVSASSFASLKAEEARLLETEESSLDLDCFLGLCGKARAK